MMNGGVMGGPFMGLVWLLLLALIIGGVWLLVRAIRGSDNGARARPDGEGTSALSILEERYARGEIDHDEFQERRRALRG